MYYTTISTNFNKLATARNRCSCSSFNIVLTATPSITSASFPKLFPRMASLRAQVCFKSDRARYGLYVGWGRTVHSRFVIAFCVFKVVCVRALSWWRRISATFLWGRIHLKRFCKVWRIWMYRSALNGLTKWNNSTKITTSAAPPPKKNSGHKFPCLRELNLLFRGEFEWCHSIGRLFICGSLWWMYRANCTVYYPDQQIHNIYI